LADLLSNSSLNYLSMMYVFRSSRFLNLSTIPGSCLISSSNASSIFLSRFLSREDDVSDLDSILSSSTWASLASLALWSFNLLKSRSGMPFLLIFLISILSRDERYSALPYSGISSFIGITMSEIPGLLLLFLVLICNSFWLSLNVTLLLLIKLL